MAVHFQIQSLESQQNEKLIQSEEKKSTHWLTWKNKKGIIRHIFADWWLYPPSIHSCIHITYGLWTCRSWAECQLFVQFPFCFWGSVWRRCYSSSSVIASITIKKIAFLCFSPSEKTVSANFLVLIWWFLPFFNDAPKRVFSTDCWEKVSVRVLLAALQSLLVVTKANRFWGQIVHNFIAWKRGKQRRRWRCACDSTTSTHNDF